MEEREKKLPCFRSGVLVFVVIESITLERHA